MKFSIILPVYNVEKYIRKCLESVVKQSYTDYELIVVNDGSKDNSGAICDEFSKKYSNITVLHIPNGGVSHARNVALSKAKGEYVWFIDSDDYLEPDSLQLLATYVDAHTDLDLLIFDANVVDEEGKHIEKLESNLPCEKAFDFDSQRKLLFANTSLWNRIYRMDIIKNEALAFEEKITIAEDLLFNYKYLLKANKIYYEKYALYYYVQRQNSAMTGAGKNKDVQKVFELLIQYYKEKELYTKYRDEIEYLAIYHYYLVTCIRMIRSGVQKECVTVAKWFKEQHINRIFGNKYVRQMALKHIVLILLLRLRCYKIISLLFNKF